MRELLVSAGFCLRSARRADCAYCNGHSRATVAFTEQVFFCHRCQRGGSRVWLARELGFLKTDLVSRARLRAEARQNRRLRGAADRLYALELRVLLRARTNLLALVALRRNAGRRLTTLYHGSRERFFGEAEFAWDALQFVADHWALASASYFVAAFASEADRAKFALNRVARAEMVERVLADGGLHGDRGRWLEFAL